MKFDDIIAILGEFGPYQKRLYYSLCVVGIFCALQMLVSVFTIAIPEYRCAIPELENDTYAIQGQGHEVKVNWTIPLKRTEDTDEWTRASCEIYNTTGLTVRSSSMANISTMSCDKYVYDTSTFTSTVITELHLVCGQEHLRSHANMLMMGGVLVGALGLGILADLVGRKIALLVAVLLHIASGVGTAFAPDYVSFVILRFLSGISNSGLFMSAFVMGMELVGPSARTKAGIIIEFFWCIGLFVLSAFAYGLRNWRHLQLAISVPAVLLVALYWLVPESPRWLASRGREEEAEKILRKAAKVNKVTLPEKIFDKSTLEQAPQGKVWELFTSPTLCIRTLIIFLNWAVASMVYYGLGLNVGNLGGDVYLNFTIANVVETVSYVLCLLLLDRAGRKFLHCGSMILGGVACLATIFPVLYGDSSLQWLTITLSMIGKLGASAAFAIIYVFSAELFPTTVRNSGMGASSCFARVGSMLSPYVADLGTLVKTHFGQALPLIVFGALAVFAGVLALLLPETLNHTLPETIEEAKNFGKKSGKNAYQLSVIPDDKNPKELNGTYNKAFDSKDM